MSHSEHPKLPSNRKFGAFFTSIFFVIAMYNYRIGLEKWCIVNILLAVAFGITTTIAPKALEKLNQAWFNLGVLLGKIVNPITLGAIFFLFLTPIALTARIFGRDALQLKKRNQTSYWVERIPNEPPPESFKNQF